MENGDPSNTHASRAPQPLRADVAAIRIEVEPVDASSRSRVTTVPRVTTSRPPTEIASDWSTRELEVEETARPWSKPASAERTEPNRRRAAASTPALVAVDRGLRIAGPGPRARDCRERLGRPADGGETRTSDTASRSPSRIRLRGAGRPSPRVSPGVVRVGRRVGVHRPPPSGTNRPIRIATSGRRRSPRNRATA